MKFEKVTDYFSEPRIRRYLAATGNSSVRTNKLYKANLKVIQSFHPVIGILEVILRNRLNHVLCLHFSDADWIINQKEGFMDDLLLTQTDKHAGRKTANNFFKKEVEKAQKRLEKNHNPITNDNVLAEQTLGFWTNLFEAPQYKHLKGKPIKIFKNLPKDTGRKEVCDLLNNIRIFRNRINHNEPVCFHGNTIDFSETRAIYEAVIKILQWIDPDIIDYIKDLNTIEHNIENAEKV